MKKVLLGTTAIVAAGMIAAPAASASDKIKLGLGGYMEQWVGFASQDDYIDPTGGVRDYSGTHMVSDSEVYFVGSTELDNGLTASVTIQLEGNSAGNQIDESFMTIGGTFGQVRIGDEDGVMSSMHYGVRDMGIGINSGDTDAWVGTISKKASDANHPDVDPALGGTSGWGGGDAPKVIYYSPRTGGVQFGISYAPGTGEDSNAKVDGSDAVTDSITTGLNYQGDMGGTMLGLSVGYRTGSANATGAEDPNAANVGIQITVGGFGFDAAYLVSENTAGRTATSAGVGVNYSQGPMGISLGYHVDEDEGMSVTAVPSSGGAAVTTVTHHAKQETVMLSGSYTLGAGVALKGTLGSASYSSDNSAALQDIDGTFAVVGFRLDF